MVTVSESEEDYFTPLENRRDDAIVPTDYDFGGKGGHKKTYSTMSGFHYAPMHGDDDFEESADYEDVDMNSNDLYVDFIRHGTRWSKRMEPHMGLVGEIASKFPVEQGKWLGRFKNRSTWLKFLHTSDNNVIVPDGVSSIDDLDGSDTLAWRDFVNTTTVLNDRGGEPATMKVIEKTPIRRYCVGATEVALKNLKEDESYLAALHNNRERASGSPIFTGEWIDVDGSVIKPYQPIDTADDGPIGSPLNPKIRLSAAITSGHASAFTISGGSRTRVPYTADFPNHDFKFNESDQLSVSGSPSQFYLLVVNPPTAPTDPGKMGFYRCQTNDGNTITVNQALGASASGIVATTVGSVAWNTGVWSGLHTDVHPAGAIGYLANAKGQPYGYSVFMGKCAMRRGYDKDCRNQREFDMKNGKWIKETYLVTTMGTAPKVSVDGSYRNFMVLAHSIHYPGTPIPTNIT